MRDNRVRHIVIAGNIKSEIITALIAEEESIIVEYEEMCAECGKEFYSKDERCTDCNVNHDHEKHEAAVLEAGFHVYE